MFPDVAEWQPLSLPHTHTHTLQPQETLIEYSY